MLIPYQDMTIAILIFARMASLVSVMPIFGFAGVPLQVKGALSLILTIIVFPIAKFDFAPLSLVPVELIILFMREILIGLAIGFITTLVFYGIQMAGQIVGIQMGFGIINIIDPISNIQISMIGQMYYLLALLIFLTMNGHHFLLQALVYSYDLIPLGGGVFFAGLVEQVSILSGMVFNVALMVAAPVMAALLITDVGLGFMARVAPQMNVFIVGFPLKILVGFLVITMVIMYFPYVFGKIYENFQQDLTFIIKLLGA